MKQTKKAPKALRPLGEIVPVIWRCLCGQFNNVDDRRCINCGAERSW